MHKFSYDDLNELAGVNMLTTASVTYPALLTREGKHSVKYIRPLRFLLFKFPFILLNGTFHVVKNNSTNYYLTLLQLVIAV